MLLPPVKKQHRLIGILLMLPFIVWSLTAVFFLVRPGFQEAYEAVPVRQYELPTIIRLEPEPDWREIRHFRSILGEHLIIRDDSGWRHLGAATRQNWSLPNEGDLTRILEDAFQFYPDRYGMVVSVFGNTAETDTGVNLVVNWPNLLISQSGRDTRWIDRVYSIHYLEWTGFYVADRILGLSGLALLLYMTITGWQMAFRPARMTGAIKQGYPKQVGHRRQALMSCKMTLAAIRTKLEALAYSRNQ